MSKRKIQLFTMIVALTCLFISHGAYADNYMGTSVAQGDPANAGEGTAIAGVTSGDMTLQENRGNTQIYAGDGKGVFFEAKNTTNDWNVTAASPGVMMAVTAAKTTINSTATTINGTLTANGGVVATQTYVTSQGYITNSALAPYATTAAMNGADGVLQADINTRVITGSAATLGSLNNSNGGITNAGAISGATSISASGTIQTSGTVSGGTGTFTTLSGTTLGGNIAAAGNNITGVSTLGATTGNIASVNSTTIANAGNIGTATLSTSGVATLNSANITTTLGVTGATTLTGALTANGGATLHGSAGGTGASLSVNGNTNTLTSGSGFTSTTVGNNAISLIADTDASAANSRGSLSLSESSAPSVPI